MEKLEIYAAQALYGGGIAISESDPSIEDVLISQTYVRDRGSGIYMINSNASISRVTISDGYAQDFGGGIYMSNSSPSIEYTEIYGNDANRGGGIYSEYSTPILRHVTIYLNNAIRKGGGIYSGNNSLITLVNTTLWNNYAVEEGGGYYSHNAKSQVLNSILWNNAPSQIHFKSTSNLNTFEVAHTTIQDGTSGVVTIGSGSVLLYDGILSDNPLFSNTGGMNVDLSLQDASPCIDAGVTNFDFQGTSIYDLSSGNEFGGEMPDQGGIETGYSLVIDEQDNIQLPQSFEMGLAYPNPFNPVTQFNYSISDWSSVSVNIFNLNGKHVKTVYSGYSAPGLHSVTWNADNQPSGFYLISVNAEGVEKTQKVLLLK